MNLEKLPPLTIVAVHVTGLYGQLQQFQTIGEAVDCVRNIRRKTEKPGVPLDGVRILVEYENEDMDTCYRCNPAYAEQWLSRFERQDIEM